MWPLPLCQDISKLNLILNISLSNHCSIEDCKIKLLLKNAGILNVEVAPHDLIKTPTIPYFKHLKVNLPDTYVSCTPEHEILISSDTSPSTRITLKPQQSTSHIIDMHQACTVNPLPSFAFKIKYESHMHFRLLNGAELKNSGECKIFDELLLCPKSDFLYACEDTNALAGDVQLSIP